MKKTILVHGILAGGVAIATLVLGFVLAGDDMDGAASSHLVGYLVMLIALSVIFLAVKRHRDRELGGIIRFGRAFLLGLGISAVAGATYVVGWEAFLAVSDFDFMATYAEASVAAMREAGASEQAVQAHAADMEVMVERYRSPLFRVPITFLEIFPVGLLVSLVAALVLRRREVLPDPDAGLAKSAG